MRRLVLSLVVLSAALLLPPGAQAQVVVDPDSPAGKEYAIPLEEKRAKAGGNESGETGDGQAAPFGKGISNPSESGTKGSSSGKGAKNKRDREDDEASGALAGSDSGGGGGDSGGGTDQAGANGALLTSGIALAVLLLGGGVAFLMRRGAFGTDA